MNRNRKMRSVEKPQDTKKTLKRLLMYIESYRILIFFSFLMTIGSTVFTIASPKIMGLITTSIYQGLRSGEGVDFQYVKEICFLLLIIYLLTAACDYLQGRLLVKLAQDMIYRFRREISEKIKHLPLQFFDDHVTGDLISRMTNDVATVGNNLRQSVSQVLSGLIMILGILVMMFSISPSLTIVALITIPLSFLTTAGLARKSQEYFKLKSSRLGKIVGYGEEFFTGIEVIKSYGYEKRGQEEFSEYNENLYQAAYRASFISGILMPIMGLINNIGYVFVAVFGGIQVIRGQILIGDIQAFIQYTNQFNRPINQTAEMINLLQETLASAERVFQFLDAEEEKPVENPKDLKVCCGNIVFDHVEFGYHPDQIIIHDLNLSIQQGETVAIVGPTGAGKTTLVNLLMRFYDVTKGSISLDGVDIRDVPRDQLRSYFGMVLQETWLFQGTIAENIAYGKDNATKEEVLEAAIAIHCDNFIRTLPDGYETILNEEASNISQGQRQLLTIARALVSNPSILILDEATSSVDTRTERIIQKAMHRLMDGRTNFVIAHRLSTIENADIILVMDQGNIVEKGSHRELLEKKGMYYSLYQSQFEQ